MPDPTLSSHGGNRPKPAADLRSPVLRRHGEALAAHAYSRIYETWPDLVERYGERGRRFTAEDNLWHLNYLDVAAALDDAGRFDRYADWLVDFFGPRGMGPHHVGGAFRFLAEGLCAIDCPGEQVHQRRLIEILGAAAERLDPAPG